MNFNENPIIKKIYQDSIANKIPYIRYNTAELLIKTINDNQCKKILEIGTAYGYSTKIISLFSCAKKIISIEKDQIRYAKALSYLANDNKVSLIHGDCFNYNLQDCNIDLIFLDGPKSNQIKLIESLKNSINDNGIIFIDNIFLNKFRKLKEKTPNQKKILNHIDELVNWIKTQNEFSFEFYDIDDGVAILKKS